MKKVLSIVCCIFFILYLAGCAPKENKIIKGQQNSLYNRKNGIVLYIKSINKDVDSLQNEILYEIRNSSEIKCKLKKEEKYLFEIKSCLIHNDEIIETEPIPVDKLVYNSIALNLTDYAYFLNEEDNSTAWGSGSWGIYVVESILDVEETTIGFYAYPYLIKAKLQFE